MPKNETLLLETRSFRAEGLCRGHAAPPFSVPHYDFPHKTGGGRRPAARVPYSFGESTFILRSFSGA